MPSKSDPAIEVGTHHPGLGERLHELEQEGLRRRLELPAGLDFTSNDYLGLSRHPEVVAAACAAAQRWGAGAPAARLLRGHLPPHAAAEEAAARWQGCAAALLFPSGYQANLALLTALAETGDSVYSDAWNHASLIDGCRLARADIHVYAHNDLNDLEARLRQAPPHGRRWIVAERVYSMEGDRAPLGELLQLCRRYDARLLLDEAHAAGLDPVLPPDPHLYARVITGGKALGLGGAFVVGSTALIEWLLNRGRAFIFTTATPPPLAAALRCAIEVVQREPHLAERAHAAAAALRARLRSSGMDVRGESPIVPVVLGASQATMELAARTRVHGYDLRGVRPPTVPAGSSRLRIVCHADHHSAQIEALAACLLQEWRALDSPRPASATRAAPAEPYGAIATPASAVVVAGTDTEVGKTVVSALIVLHRQSQGRRVRYWKPVQTGGDCDTTEVRALTGLDREHARDPLLALPLAASVDQAAAALGVEVDTPLLVHALGHALQQHAQDNWVLECAGGLRVPFHRQVEQLDLLQQLNLPVVLVSRSGLGTLNHTLLSAEALARRALPLLGIVLVGPPHPANAASLRARLPGVPLLSLPPLETLDRESLQRWLCKHPLDPILP